MDNNGRKIDRVPPAGKWATKDDVVAGIAAGSLAMGQKVYTQCMEQTVRLLAEMEFRLEAKFASVVQERDDLLAQNAYEFGPVTTPTDSEGAG